MGKMQGGKVAKASQGTVSGSRYELEITESIAQSLLRRLIVWIHLPGHERSRLDVQMIGNVLTIKEAAAQAQAVADLQRSEIIGKSRKLQTCLGQVARAATVDETVLVCGETGTGKELFARAIHKNSARREDNFVVADCRSIPESIAEKLLFGQDKRSRFNHGGMVPQAHRGTLFLDEVGDLPDSVQKLICQLLLKKRYRPVGARADRSIDVRLIAATNRNLQQLVTSGKFSAELLNLLQPLLVEVPPLRERQDDITLLTDYFLQQFYAANELVPKVQSPEFTQLLQDYPWPGNVRELQNSLGQALLAAKNKRTLFPKDLPAHIRIQVKKLAVRKNQAATPGQTDEAISDGLLIPDAPL